MEWDPSCSGTLCDPFRLGSASWPSSFEAFASGLPVVTTSIGIGGTHARDGVEVIVRDDPESITQAAIEIIKNPDLAKKISGNAKELVKNKYDWDKVAQLLSKIYEELGKI